MNLLKIDQQIDDFKQRIIKTLKLQQCSNNQISKQKRLCNWMTKQLMKLKKPKEDSSDTYRKIVTGFVQKIMKTEQHPKDHIQNDLKNLSQFVKKKFIPKTFAFQSKNVPEQIVSIVNELKQKKWDNYYGEVKGPFFSNMFILKKQDFHSSVQQVKVNGLKLMMIQQKVAHKYQRNLIQQIFGRVFRTKGTLSLVIKVKVNQNPLESSYNLFCYIQDRKLVDEDTVWKSLSQLQQNGSKLQLPSNGKLLQVNQLNLLQLFLAQILVVPVQSLVSQFVIKIVNSKDSVQKKQAEIIKCNQQDQQQIVKETSLREHPSLRNPLLYFSTYLREHSIKISEAQKLSANKQLYACFYRSLQIVVRLLLTDFRTSTQQIKINSSICFNLQVFTALWGIFHKISLLSGWMEEVIQPIKNTITISEVISHFCPIFNQISMSYNNAENFNIYKEFYNNVEMESYLGTVVSKKTLQKYKDVFINENQAATNKKYTNVTQIYNQIFKPIFQQANLQYLDPIQSSYILYFACKYKYQYHPLSTNISPKWKQPLIWEKCVKCLSKHSKSQTGQVSFIDIGFDILGYACGINIFELDNKCFERVKNFDQTESSLLGISWFCDFIHQNHQKKSSIILSSLLQNAFKHKKFQTCKKLLQKRIRIRDFHQIIGFHEIVNEIDEKTRQTLIKTIQEDSPQMHRLFKWQQLMLIHLQKGGADSVSVQTLDFGTIYLPKQVFQTNLKKGKLLNNLSRKDYKFDSGRQIAKINFRTSNGKDAVFYLQISQYPLMPYFFRSFFSKFGTPEIMPYFTSFFYQNKLFHIIQCLDQSINYKKGLTSFKQEQLNALTDENLISEAILLSMMVIPAQIKTSDIIICPSKATHDQIFIVDWHTYYCKNYMHKYMGKISLNTQNSLFLMDKMSKTIQKKIINKYSKIEIQKICQEALVECKKINKKVAVLKQKFYNNQDQINFKNQLLAIMFQQGFIFNVAQRMYKIKRIFTKKQGNFEKGLSFYRVLELLNSQTSYYYQQIFNSNQNIMSREKVLFDQNWKRPFLQNSFVQFFGSFLRLEQVDNVFPIHYERFCFQGPTQNLVYTATNMRKFVSFNIGQIPQNLSQFTKDDFEYYMRNCDLSDLDLSKKQKLFQIIKNKSKQYLSTQERRVLPLSYMCIKSMQFIKDKSISSSFSLERLQQLCIQSCKLGDYELNSFSKSIQNISYLYLRDICGLKYIGQNALYGKVIQIKHLKTLSIIQCNDLISVDIKCDILQNLQLRNNKNLETISIYSLNLKNISVYNNPSLNFQNIGIYIIKGINVLVCKSSCGGDLMKLYSDDYETYVAYAMRYLLIRFYQSSESRYNVLLTLFKMKQADQNLLAMGGISNVKAISAVFNKYTTDVEDKILTQLLRIYIQNPYRKKVAIADLTQSITISNNLSTQRVIRCLNEALNKVRDSLKQINQIKFDNTKLFFANINCNHVKVFINRLRIDKNLTLILQNLNQQVQSQDADNKETVARQIDAIRYLGMERPELQKMTLTFRKSTIKMTFLDRIFKGTESLQQIMKNQQQFSPKEPNTRSKIGLSFRQTLKQQNQNYMKIINLNLQGCTIKNDRIVGLQKIQHQLKQAQQKSKQAGELSQIQLQQICQSGINYSSIKNVKLQNCLVTTIDVLQSMKNLTSLSIYKCQFGANSKKKLKVSAKQQSSEIDPTISEPAETKNIQSITSMYEKLFRFLQKRDLHTLDLQNFFTSALQQEQYNRMFDNFCIVLTKMKKLKILKLNKNYFTLQSLQKLDKIINQTQIEELQLNELVLPLTGSSIISGQKQKPENQKQIYKIFSTLFSQTVNLKSLAIQLNYHQAVQNFMQSISKNTSIIELKLNTNCQISSNVLKYLNKNKVLSFISSNMQLPVWLLNHVSQNGKNMRKSFIKQDAQKQSKFRLEESMSLGSMNNIRNNDFFRIGLSLDGGGVRGMLLATQLNYLASRVGYPLHKIFDCIGGTSIGGILALASAGTLDGQSPVANTEELMVLFSKYGKDIFKKTQIMQFKNLFDTKYSASSFEGVLKNYFKDCKLSDCLPQTNVIVTAVNRVDNKDYIFKSMEALLNRDRDFYMRDAARATSAAPTYFPSAEIKNVNASIKLSLVDGGVGLNNPSKLVIDQVKKIATNSGTPQNYFLLSLGTGKLPSQVIPEYAGLKDLSPIIDSFTQSAAYFVQRDLATNYKGHFFRVSPLINVAVKKDAQLDNTSEQIIEMYKQTGLQAAKKYFENTVIFGKYRNMNIIQWLRENTVKKYEY